MDIFVSKETQKINIYCKTILDNNGKFVDKSLTFEKLPIQKITEIEAEKMLKIRIFEFQIQIKKHFN